MKTYILIALMFIGLSCNKNENAVDKAPVENADPTAIEQGIGVPSEYLAAHNDVVQALNAFDATLTPEKIQAYNGDVDRAIADMTVFVTQRIGLPSETTVPGARGAVVSPDPSAVVNTWVSTTNGKLDALEALVDAEKVSDAQAKATTNTVLATAYNQIASHPEIYGADRNSLLGSHYSANGLLVPVESILEKLVPHDANGRMSFWKKLRKAVLTFVRVVVVKTVQSFAKGCFQGVSSSGSLSSCIPGGVAKASTDLTSNLQEGLKKAAGK